MASLETIAANQPELIPEALSALHRDGAVVISGALAPETVNKLSRAIGVWHEKFLRGEIQNYSLDDETATDFPDAWAGAFTTPPASQTLRKWNAVQLEPSLLDLVDAAPHYELMVALFGAQLSVTKTQFIVVPSSCLETPYLHTDAGSMADIVLSPDSAPLMCSIQFFLTPLKTENMGNFTCVPRSHRTAFPWPEDDEGQHSQIRIGKPPLGQDIDAARRFQVRVDSGDAVIFFHSLWHGVSSNNSATDRRSIIFSYAKSFVRPYDYVETPDVVRERGSERQRLLFSDLGSWSFRPGCNYHYSDRLRSVLQTARGPAGANSDPTTR
ncbi:phytanoyl-CoA dioxygenase family protein [Saccharopolyspora shandongensis]|uniref:phytanoyl-CoA dioxygenase family protein n=1 Tax=Saccharopolyspora shandongensis TaxID=418495 RepID=UPI0034326672